MKRLLIALGAAALTFVVVSAIVIVTSDPKPAPRSQPAAVVEIGGPFRMRDQDGREVTEALLKTGPTVVFFGFTYCPEVCPTTLARLTAWMKALGPKADGLNVLFVSVDPERDTPEQLKAYLTSFDPRIRGLSGTPQMLDQMTKGYRAYYKKVALPDGGYTMDHSSTIYLFDRKGLFQEVITYQEETEAALEALRRITR
jgi:protein SCO1/2